MELNQELTDAIKKVLKLNPYCKLSGSTALYIQGYNLNREIHDLDFELPFNNELITDNELIENEIQNEDYISETHDVILAELNGISLNFFKARKSEFEIRDCEPHFVDESEVWLMCLAKDILKKKLEIVLEKRNGCLKQANDLLVILSRIIKEKSTESDLPF